MKERDIRPKKVFDKFLHLTSLDIKKYFSKSKVKINCVACGEKGKFSFKKEGFSYYECQKCQTLFVNPRPKEDSFENFYKKSISLNYKNPGAVVKKGETILLIVPIDQKLIVTGKLFVKDRGYVKVGQSAKIKLANQDQLKFGPIDAKIISISPNAVQSQKGTWYEIELELKQQKFTSGNIDYTLVPGIQVQIFILTGNRSILSYITNPFYNSIGQALQER